MADTEGEAGGDGTSIEQLRARYQALVEQIPAVLYVNLCDADDTNIYVSPQTNTILGLSEDDWQAEGKDWVDYIDEGDRQRVIDDYEDHKLHGTEGVDEYRFTRPDGRKIWLHDRIAVIRDERGDPSLVQGVMFDITEQREATETIARQVRFLEKADEVGRAFTDLVLAGGDLQAILDTLSSIAGNPVVLEDAARQPLAWASEHGELDEVLSGWNRHSRSGHELSGGGPTDAEGCAWIPVRIRSEEWGRIHLLHLRRAADRMDRLALDRAGAAVGLSLLAERDAAHLAENARTALISDIWSGRYPSSDEPLRKARGLGAQLEGLSLVPVVIETSGRNRTEADRRRDAQAVLRAFRTALEETGLAGLSALVGDRASAIVGLREDQAKREAIDDLAGRTTQLLTRIEPNIAVTMGIGRPTDAGGLRRALEEAGEAADFGARTGSGVHHFEDLGVHQLLARLRDGPELARFVEAELEPLLAHDAEGGAPLLDTLRAYLGNGGRKSETARALHLERRSLYYRIGRIEALLGRNLDDHESRLRLGVALEALDLIRTPVQTPASRGVRERD